MPRVFENYGPFDNVVLAAPPTMTTICEVRGHEYIVRACAEREYDIICKVCGDCRTVRPA